MSVLFARGRQPLRSNCLRLERCSRERSGQWERDILADILADIIQLHDKIKSKNVESLSHILHIKWYLNPQKSSRIAFDGSWSHNPFIDKGHNPINISEKCREYFRKC